MPERDNERRVIENRQRECEQIDRANDPKPILEFELRRPHAPLTYRSGRPNARLRAPFRGYEFLLPAAPKAGILTADLRPPSSLLCAPPCPFRRSVV